MAIDSPKNSETKADGIVENLAIPSSLRTLIAESWNRSAAAGVATTADKVIFHRVPDDDLLHRQLVNKNLLRAAAPHLNWLSAWLGNIPHVVYLVDRDGIILFSVGNYDNADAFGLTPGFNWSEAVMGTNGAGTAIATDRALAVMGPEHISEPFQGFT